MENPFIVNEMYNNLMLLPAEMLFYLCYFLDVGSLVRLGRTCHLFHLVTFEIIDTKTKLLLDHAYQQPHLTIYARPFYPLSKLNLIQQEEIEFYRHQNEILIEDHEKIIGDLYHVKYFNLGNSSNYYSWKSYIYLKYNEQNQYHIGEINESNIKKYIKNKYPNFNIPNMLIFFLLDNITNFFGYQSRGLVVEPEKETNICYAFLEMCYGNTPRYYCKEMVENDLRMMVYIMKELNLFYAFTKK